MASSPSKLASDSSKSTLVLPSDPSKDHSDSSALSSFPSPGRCVLSLTYQEFYISTAEKMRDKAGEGKKVKEKKVRKRVEREWGEHAQSLNLNTDLPLPAELEDTAVGHVERKEGGSPNGEGGQGGGGKHQVWRQNGEEESSEGE
ncbi:hypothetical protein JCM6882_004461 [Rhodosporidiobolus microsporus]